MIQGYDRAATSYDQAAGMIYLKALQGLLPFVRVASCPSILDVGCGTGINLFEASRVLAPCRRLVGVDLSPGMVNVARRKAAAYGVSAVFSVGDAQALDVEDGAFDLVICNSAYHWFPDRARAIAELARALRPGGQLVIASLAQPGFDEWFSVVHDVWRRLFGCACPAFPEMPDAAALPAQLRAAGLGIEHFKYQLGPTRIADIPAFVSMMAVISPAWLSDVPSGTSTRVMEETERALATRSHDGFVCTYAAVEAVARKGEPIPPTLSRAPARVGRAVAV